MTNQHLTTSTWPNTNNIPAGGIDILINTKAENALPEITK